MATPAQLHSYSEDFAFQFDAPFPSRVYDSVLSLTGWLVDRKARPIYGLRAVIKRSLLRRKICRARRKRERPDVATAFPTLPDSRMSGFLFELQLGAGSNRITFQVQDHKRVWRTFHATSIAATPLNFLDLIGFRQFRFALVRVLQGSFFRRARTSTRPSGSPKPELAKPSLASAISAIKRIDLLMTSKSNLFIREIGELIGAGFREIDCETRILLDRPPTERPSPDTLQIVVTPHEYYNLFLTQEIGFEKAQQLTRQVVLLCTEQPETEWFQSNLWWTSQARAVADISPLGAAAYRARGLPCYCLPLGYHPILGTAEPSEGERPYDVTFLGSMTHRRDAFFAESAPFFSEHRCHIRLVPLGFAKTKQTRSYLSVEKRNELLSQTKLLLNVHYSDQKYFEWHRMLAGIANGCCLISEKCEGYGALIPGEHFIMVEQDQLIEVCDYYLNNPGERNRIASNALSFLKSKLNQAEHCRSFLRQYQAGPGVESPHQTVHIDTDLPFDAKPVALPPALRRRLTREARLCLLRAVAIDLHRIRRTFLGRRAKPMKRSRSSAITSQEIESKRKEFRLRWHEQEKAALSGKAILERHENDAYRSVHKPILSIVVTLHNYAHFIGDCIASIEQAIARTDTSAEIVIVNDASEDDSLARALHYQKISRHPVLVADKKWNTGLADTRNKAVHLARGKYVFMMDADNLVLPRALRELVDLLDSNDYDAAYTIICRFRDTPANRLGLLSYFDWDPQILAQYPYIDAMAMFRRDVLLELSGYDNQLSQIGWFGWEDYDLWLRFATKNYKVGFVPNILCLYRIHDTSMIHTTTLYELELVQHLVENYGELLDRFEPQRRVFGVDRDRVFDSTGRLPDSNRDLVALANDGARNTIKVGND
ncbi:MAG: hypothetical protein QOH24_2292 [Verrucomicrobiota bacterium]